jgi:excisionase family DNA binding protein
MGMVDALDSWPKEPYIRTAQAAQILQVSPKTVSRWAKDGKLPHVVTLGGHRRFPRSAIEELARRLRNHSH